MFRYLNLQAEFGGKWINLVVLTLALNLHRTSTTATFFLFKQTHCLVLPPLQRPFPFCLQGSSCGEV